MDPLRQPYQGAFRKCKISVPQTQCIRIYIFNKILRWFVCSLKFQKQLLKWKNSFACFEMIHIKPFHKRDHFNIAAKALKKINISIQPEWIIRENALLASFVLLQQDKTEVTPKSRILILQGRQQLCCIRAYVFRLAVLSLLTRSKWLLQKVQNPLEHISFLLSPLPWLYTCFQSHKLLCSKICHTALLEKYPVMNTEPKIQLLVGPEMTITI